MEEIGWRNMNKRRWYTAISIIGMVFILAGCGESKSSLNQTAVGGHIDFDELKEQNPEIFAWVYVPGTGVDLPVLQSAESDTYYENHDWQGNENEDGSLYTEMANLMNMCDFNTIIHGHTTEEETMLSGLHNFEDEEFFGSNGQVYVYLPDNVLTYHVISCYKEDKRSIIRDYNLVSYEGCEEYIADMQASADENGIYRSGWEEITPYHFLLSFVTDCPDDDDKQYVVTAALVDDATGQIDRTVYEN